MTRRLTTDAAKSRTLALTKPKRQGLDDQTCRDDFAISYIVIDAFGWEMLAGSI
jgi:hypothetical protein